MKFIYIGGNTFIGRNHHNSKFLQILKLIMKEIFLIKDIKQLTFITNILCKRFSMVSELNVDLQCGYFNYCLRFDIVEWFVVEVIKIQKRINFFFEAPRKILQRLKEMRNFQETILFVGFEKNV